MHHLLEACEQSDSVVIDFSPEFISFTLVTIDNKLLNLHMDFTRIVQWC